MPSLVLALGFFLALCFGLFSSGVFPVGDLISLWFMCYIAGFLISVVPVFVAFGFHSVWHIFSSVSGDRIGGVNND